MPPTTIGRPWSIGEHFPLGQPFGMVQTTPEPSDARTRPFGLRFAVEPIPAATVALDRDHLTYDPVNQMAVMNDGGVISPVFRHSGDTTNTSTASQDRSGDDSDQDASGD